MPTQLIFVFVLMALALGYTLYMKRKIRAGMPAAFRMFFERTGYRYADIYDQPLEAHIMHGEKLMGQSSNGYHVHMVRDFHGAPIHSEQSYRVQRESNKITTSTSASWWTPLPTPPKIPLQIAEKSLTGAFKAVKEAFSNQTRTWEQKYPLPVLSQDPELDARFLFFGKDSAAVLQAVRTPGLKELLLGCAEVDLTVYDDRIIYADPLQKNMNASMGGMVGSMALGADMMKRMELTIPVHNRLAQLLALIRTTCQ